MTRQPKRTTGRILGAVLAVVLLAALTACGSSSGSNAKKPTTSTTAAGAGKDAALTVAQVDQLQADLNTLGCIAGNVDGVYGPHTAAALLLFQQTAKQTVTGVPTVAVLDSVKAAAKAGTPKCPAPAPAPTTVPPTTAPPSPSTSPTTAPAGPPACTDAAVQAALPKGTTLVAYGCSDVYAWAWSAPSANAGADTSYILKANGTAWQSLPTANICGGASAGYPPTIVTNGCQYA